MQPGPQMILDSGLILTGSYCTAVHVPVAQSWCQPTSTSSLINSSPTAWSPLSHSLLFTSAWSLTPN